MAKQIEGYTGSSIADTIRNRLLGFDIGSKVEPGKAWVYDEFHEGNLWVRYYNTAANRSVILYDVVDPREKRPVLIGVLAAIAVKYLFELRRIDWSAVLIPVPVF